MGITITNSGQGSVVRFRNLGRGGIMTTSIVPGLLNQYPGAAAAYSLRKLNKGYSGAAIRVRRSSDNAETNIGFVNGELDTTSLSTFVGTANNLIPYSEDFTQWTLNEASTINSNITTDPIGGNTADRLNFGSSITSQIFYPQSTLTNGVTYVVSLYVKSDTKSNFRFKVSDGTTQIFSPNITINSNWTRYDYTFTNAPVSSNVAIVNESGGGVGAIFIWGYQLNIRTLQTYTQTIGTAKNNNGFITKWYDQSGNSRDAVQATTANQPRIIYGGSITYINGKPTVENIANSYLATAQTAFTTLQTHSDFIVTKALTQTQSSDYVGYLVFGPSSGNDYDSNTAMNINADQISTGKNLSIQGSVGSSYVINGSGLVTLHRLITHIINSQSGQAYSNTVSVGTATGTFATTNGGALYIGIRYVSGAPSTGYSYLGFFQEIISYNTNQTSNKRAIESNINSFYSIYTPNDSDAEAFFDRVTTAGGTLSATEQTAVNTLVVSMKAAGIWTAMKAIYPMVGSSAAACAQNLKSSNFTGTFTAGWTFANTGATPNGTSAFMNTGLNVSTNISLNNVHFSVYLRTNSDGTKVDLGVFGGGNSGLNIFTRFGNAQYTRLNEEDTATVSTTDSRGFRLGIRNSSTQKNVFINNTKTTLNTNSNSLINLPIYIGALNDQTLGARFYSDRQNAFASIGDGLSDTNASDFYTIVQAFQTTLSRQI